VNRSGLSKRRRPDSVPRKFGVFGVQSKEMEVPFVDDRVPDRQSWVAERRSTLLERAP
jgi:hypothetical protein